MVRAVAGNGYIYRDATAADRAEALAFTAHTWEFGDYIKDVFDSWLTDPDGLFLVAEVEATGQVAAIDKLTMLSPTEAWFEGLRVHPDHRGRGLASSLQRFMLGEAARLGARTVRLLTLAVNRPIHLAAYRDGFRLASTVRFWKWEAGAQYAEGEAYDLRAATTKEAPLLYNAWRKAAAWRTAGLVHLNWSFAETSPPSWEAAASEGRLFVTEDAAIAENALPTPAIMVKELSDVANALWSISAVTAMGDEWTLLMRGLVAAAQKAGVGELHGLLPDTQEIYRGMEAAGFRPDGDDERLCIFELSLVGEQ